MPLVFAFIATKQTGLRWWTLAVLWLLFLPNSFYIVTDLIHLNPTEASLEGYRVGSYRYVNEASSPGILFDAVLIFMYAAYGFLAGLISTSLIHDRLTRFFTRSWAWILVISSLAVSSFAIYVGRVLRWNSWDVVTNPGGLISDIFEVFASPLENADAWGMTALFFFASTSFYLFYRSLLYLSKDDVPSKTSRRA